MKELLRNTRDALAYSFSWLMICVTAILLLGGKEVISVATLCKLFGLCLWGSVSFSLCFRNGKMMKKGFLFSLTCFYILFIPVEIFLFYSMGIFRQNGSTGVWIVFFAIIALLYLTALYINAGMKKKAVVYTEKLHEYQRQSQK